MHRNSKRQSKAETMRRKRVRELKYAGATTRKAA